MDDFHTPVKQVVRKSRNIGILVEQCDVPICGRNDVADYILNEQIAKIGGAKNLINEQENCISISVAKTRVVLACYS